MWRCLYWTKVHERKHCTKKPEAGVGNLREQISENLGLVGRHRKTEQKQVVQLYWTYQLWSCAWRTTHN